MTVKRSVLLGTIVVTAVITAVVTVAIAGAPAPRRFAGGRLTAVKAVSQVDYNTSTTTGTYENVPGAETTIGGKGRGLLIMTFSGSSFCTGSGGDACQVRILVDGDEAHPRGLSIFDGVPDSSGYDGQESLSMQKFIKVGGGPHTVEVQFKSPNSGEIMDLRGWTLTVMRFSR